ncbi:hypothetical protein HMPREF9123_2692 [Neisseria bacilliformis ATCC BAA-1200]|uniref:Uncharacterized protein n=1 Tax=Neisseria bacilliformis ATCC BAA-1200 TaxID=888742 RepID=F2BG35_9NEIS|nr:hypothetical protein HMPREF9123_2692 [Neisseria bacilliformis ATCC BAA-1200]
MQRQPCTPSVAACAACVGLCAGTLGRMEHKRPSESAASTKLKP